MPIVNKTSPELVYDAINEANQNLPVPASPATVLLGAPVVQVPPSGSVANTKVVLTPAGDGSYLGRKEVQYRRREFPVWFRGMLVRIDAWHPNKSGSANWVNTFTLHQLLPRLNAKYGLKLTTDDITDVQFQANSNSLDADGRPWTARTMTAKVTSLGWVGSVTVEWHDAARSLIDAIAINDLPNTRTYPGGNDFSVAHKEVVNFMGFGVDWSSWAAVNPWPGFPAITNVSSTAWNAWLAKFFTEINRIYGTSLTGVVAVDAPYPVGTATTSRIITLPDDAYPELNSRFYNRCLLVPILPTSETMAGTFALHYNV